MVAVAGALVLHGPGTGLELTNALYPVLTGCGALHDAITGRSKVSTEACTRSWDGRAVLSHRTRTWLG